MEKGQPAAVKIYNVPNFETVISQKSFFKGDKVQLKWNDNGTTLIVLAQTEVDKSGKSYYGETTLYLMSANGGFDSRIDLGKYPAISSVSSRLILLQTRMALYMTLPGHPIRKNSAWCMGTCQLKPQYSIPKLMRRITLRYRHGIPFFSHRTVDLCSLLDLET